MIGIHPKALTSLSDLDKKLRTEINKRISAYKGPVDFLRRDYLKVCHNSSSFSC